MNFSRLPGTGNSHAGYFRKILKSRGSQPSGRNIHEHEIFANLPTFAKLAKISCMRKICSSIITPSVKKALVKCIWFFFLLSLACFSVPDFFPFGHHFVALCFSQCRVTFPHKKWSIHMKQEIKQLWPESINQNYPILLQQKWRQTNFPTSSIAFQNPSPFYCMFLPWN